MKKTAATPPRIHAYKTALELKITSTIREKLEAFGLAGERAAELGASIALEVSDIIDRQVDKLADLSMKLDEAIAGFQENLEAAAKTTPASSPSSAPAKKVSAPKKTAAAPKASPTPSLGPKPRAKAPAAKSKAPKASPSSSDAPERVTHFHPPGGKAFIACRGSLFGSAGGRSQIEHVSCPKCLDSPEGKKATKKAAAGAAPGAALHLAGPMGGSACNYRMKSNLTHDRAAVTCETCRRQIDGAAAIAARAHKAVKFTAPSPSSAPTREPKSRTIIEDPKPWREEEPDQTPSFDFEGGPQEDDDTAHPPATDDEDNSIDELGDNRP